MNVKLMVIDEGHTVSGPDYGAVGNGLCESIESRELGGLVTKYAKELGIIVDKCTVDYANSVADSITKRVALANKRSHDVLVIIHFNNYIDESAHGCEVFILPNTNGNYGSTASYNKNKEFGEKILQAVCDAGDFYKRGGGVKFREDLGMLCSTRDHAVYLEVCFLSNESDAQKYRTNKDNIARAIAETLAGKKLNTPGERKLISCLFKWIPSEIEKYKDEKEILITNVESTPNKLYDMHVVKNTNRPSREQLFDMYVDGKKVLISCLFKWIPGEINRYQDAKEIKIVAVGLIEEEPLYNMYVDDKQVLVRCLYKWIPSEIAKYEKAKDIRIEKCN
ncbi:N-acetylmuramoyl-L-alanine amidase CwlD [uncultured Clostridium sp.]|uniref:N-acetylmuramoyl-L-alanine amidase n=1 Tax=uncultured Clostridium sp. TaxID=59620 RepID=UPI0008225975|nr:N-acetylmuramoyl-L-alanine amidase [uncultured Clostridium sp.]SCK04729.1 N-acetylmuramoyl-L-alanine amidase CwlD [uncultured Clostridium sp.]